MKTLFNEAAATADGGWLMGIMTVVFLVFFTGWVIWAYAPRNRARHDEAARIPFDGSEV